LKKIVLKEGKKLILLLIPLFLFTSCASLNNTSSSIDASYEKPSNNAMSTTTASKETAVVIPTSEIHSQLFKEKVMLLASELTSNLKEYNKEMKTAVVSTFVNLDDLSDTSRFGRFATESLVYEMHRSGYRVYEMRQSKKVAFLKRNGEFSLTRKGTELLDKYSSDAVIVGTYSLVNEELTLYARMIDKKTSRIISVASVSFPLDNDPYTSDLLDGSSGIAMPIKVIEGAE